MAETNLQGGAAEPHRRHAAEAVGQLLREHYALVVAIAMARLRDPDAAEDLAQEVFLRAFVSLDLTKDARARAAWLVCVARNLATDWQRRRQSASRLTQELGRLSELRGEWARTSDNPRERMMQRERHAALDKALDELDEAQREIVLLHYMNDLSRAEIADKLGIHRSTVTRQLDAALNRLKRSLEPALRQRLQSMKPDGAAFARADALLGAMACLPGGSHTALLGSAVWHAGEAAISGAAKTLGAASGKTAISAKGVLTMLQGKALVAVAVIALIGASLAMHYAFKSNAAQSSDLPPLPAATAATRAPSPSPTPSPTPTPAASSTPPPTPAFASDAKTTGTLRLQKNGEQQNAAAGSFVGRVTDKAGKPIADVAVKWAKPEDVDHSTDMAKTDADGRYALTISAGKPDRQHILTAIPAAPLASAWKWDAVPGTPEKPATVDFTLEVGGWLGVTVVDEQQNPLQGIVVSVIAQTSDFMAIGRHAIPGQSKDGLKTDASGRVRFEQLPLPAVGLSASGKGHTPTTQKDLALNQEFTLAMRPSGNILGSVVDDVTGKPISAFKAFATGNGVDTDRMRKGDTFTDADGRFKYDDLYLDSVYGIRIAAEGYAESGQDNVLAAREKDAKEIAIQMKKAVTLSVEVVDAATQAPLNACKVMLGWYNPDFGDDHHIDWTNVDRGRDAMFTKLDRQQTDASGKAELVDGAIPGVILILADGYQPLKIEADQRAMFKTGENQYRVPLQAGIVVTGVYLAPDGSPLTGQTVSLEIGEDNNARIKTDAQGAYAFKGARQGTGTLSGWTLRNNMSFDRYVKRVTVTANPVQKIDIGDKLGPYKLSGRILDGDQPQDGASIRLKNQFGWEYEYFADYSQADGTYLIEGLQAGKYSVILSWGMQNPRRMGEIYHPGEEITLVIEGDTVKDFDLGDGHKVTGRLVFPEAMDAAARAGFNQAYLTSRRPGPSEAEQRQQYQDLQQQGIEQSLQLARNGDILEGRGNLKGEYLLTLFTTKISPGRMERLQTIISKKYQIDSTGKDVDLGDIPVPMPSGVRFKLTFAREQDKAPFKIVKIVSTIPAALQGMGEEVLTYHDSTVLAEGPDFARSGRFKGDYCIQLSVSESGFGSPPSFIRVPGHVHCDDPNVETDWGEIIVYPIYRIRAKLVFADPAARAALSTAVLAMQGNKDAAPTGDENGLTRQYECPIGADGTVEFPGLYMGQYKLTLTNGRGNPGASIALPAMHDLSNGEKDQDLGDILAGGLGFIRVQVTLSDPAHAPKSLMAFVGAELKQGETDTLHLQPAAGEQRVGPLQPGPQHLRFIAAGFRVDPPETYVTVVEQQANEPVLKLTLSPEGSIVGIVQFESRPEGDAFKQLIDGVQIVMDGPGGAQTLKPVMGSSDAFSQLFLNAKHGAMGTENNCMFFFRGLDKGDYKIQITAPGCAALEQTIQVAPGKGENPTGFLMKKP